MLNQVIYQTNKYIEQIPKDERKQYGQFFTSRETAEFMAKMFDISDDITLVSILDPGAGSGILSCALLERLENIDSIKSIELTCYETDKKILPLLQDNLEYCRSQMTTSLTYTIKTDNYITSQYLEFNSLLGANPNPPKYDFVIGNPPYMKVQKDAPEATAMPEVCHGAPNMYFLFSAMSLYNLKNDGEMVYIIPRSWTSGAYFTKFRQYFLTEGKLEQIHLFGSRTKVFDKEDVLQETIIVKLKKTYIAPKNVIITSSRSNSDFKQLTTLIVPYDLVVSGDDSYVYLVTNEDEVKVLDWLHRFKDTLPDLGLRMKTGLTVDFRSWEALRDEPEENAVPLFYAQHIKNGKVTFPIGKEHEYLVTEQRGLLQKNKNYLFVKRFTAKEEPRRLQCGIYLAKDFPGYKQISTHNKVNFIDSETVEMTDDIVFGLYVIFNSTLYDQYYRILNGSTQVNSTEINAMPVPELDVIKQMGQDLMRTDDLSEENCNKILEAYCG